MSGASALLKLSKLSGKAYFNYEGKPDFRVPITCFRKDLQSLGANYLEDFLCIYHQLLECWALGYEIKKTKSLKIKKRNHK